MTTRAEKLKQRRLKLLNFKQYIKNTGTELTPEWEQRVKDEEDLVEILEIEAVAG